MGRSKCFSGDGTVPFFANVNFSTGEVANTWIDSLSAFFPGLLTLSGDVEEAVCLHFLYFTIWRMFDAFPERFDWNKLSSVVHFYPLRPELIERFAPFSEKYSTSLGNLSSKNRLTDRFFIPEL
jgi:mannosidase alpha-like ER degradation enhancer 1